jgi:hypothetical protein
MCSSGGCMAGACGKVGEPCCGNGGNGNCTSPYSVCGGGGGGGGNTCRACGGNGQACCATASGVFCGAPFTCNRATMRCG